MDGYIIPKNDKYFTEYSNVNNLSKISKFTGSAGFAIVLKKEIICLLMDVIHFKQINNVVIIFKF